jgi:hypothetical protein
VSTQLLDLMAVLKSTLIKVGQALVTACRKIASSVVDFFLGPLWYRSFRRSLKVTAAPTKEISDRELAQEMERRNLCYPSSRDVEKVAVQTVTPQVAASTAFGILVPIYREMVKAFMKKNLDDIRNRTTQDKALYSLLFEPPISIEQRIRLMANSHTLVIAVEYMVWQIHDEQLIVWVSDILSSCDVGTTFNLGDPDLFTQIKQFCLDRYGITLSPSFGA